MENKKIKVAQIMGKWVGGGVEAVIMNYYCNIDNSKIEFDFIFDSDSIYIPRKEIEAIGGNVIVVPPYQCVLKYQKELKRIFKNNKYDIVHSNINTLSVIPLRVAKKCNIPIRIAHSHSTTIKIEVAKNILKQVLRPFSKVYANEFFACSEVAGRWQFGDKTFEKGRVTLINNAIDIERFKYNEIERKNIRESLGLSDETLVIGSVGRFVKTKNQSFLLDVLEELIKQNNNSKLLLMGQGPLEGEIKEKIKQKGLQNNVIIVGQRNDIERYYQAMDVFTLPSLYEGLGMVLIEAQTSGLPCIASTNVPKITKVTDNFEFLPIDNNYSNINLWVSAILNASKSSVRRSNKELISSHGYDIKKEAINLQNKYIELVNKYKKG